MRAAMFFDGWEGVIRVLAAGTSAYACLITLLRISGKRTLAKLNAFDFVITVALGSTLATILLSAEVALVEGIVAMVLLVSLQYVVAWLTVRHRTVERLVKSEPTLVYRGGFLDGSMRRSRVTQDELRQAARASGHPDLTTVSAIVLETDGTLSILSDWPQGNG